MIFNTLALGLPVGSEWIIILLVILLLFGGSKIPQLMRGIGKGVGEFQSGLKHSKKMLDDAIEEAATEADETEAKKTAVTE